MTARWALVWHSQNKLDGVREWIIWENCQPLLFLTRQEARQYAARQYGYIKMRKDLRTEPHGWRFPRAVRVTIDIREKDGR